jgi:4-hydroxybutyrate dehydrogenase
MAKLSIWSFPTRVVFGVGAVRETGNEAQRLGVSRALVVADKGVVSAGLAKAVEESLGAAGIAVTVFADVDPNPVEKNVHDGVRAFRDFGADVIVAVGGGSPLDVGKIIRLKARPGVHERPLVDYDDATGGDEHITADVPPMLALPTTAGTGSEVGRSGVVTLEVNRRKTVIFSPHLMANAAILDPQLTESMPARTTAATGFDALTHCLEAYVALGDHPMADAIALGGLQLVAENLVLAVSTPKDLDARGAMMKAAMMGAVAFQKGLGACHSLAHPLSNICGLHHGLANALCLPAVVEFNAEVAGARLSQAARALGADASPRALSAKLRELQKAIGLPSSLAAAGVKREHLGPLADGAFEDACHRYNPRPCTRADLLALYEASM